MRAPGRHRASALAGRSIARIPGLVRSGLAFFVAVWSLAVSTMGQVSTSRVEPPDAYAAFEVPALAERYRREAGSNVIANPDFFCTACSKEGRIAAKQRNDLKTILEVRERQIIDGKGVDMEFGAFRLCEEKADHVLRYLFDELKSPNPVFIEDFLFRLFTDLPAADCREGNAAIGPELAELVDIFPELKSEVRTLNPHQRAHLTLIRAHRIRRGFEALIGATDGIRGAAQTWGPFYGQAQKHEIYVFDAKKPFSQFTTAFLNREPNVDGLWLRTLKDSSMVLAVHVPNLNTGTRDTICKSVVTHRLAFNLALSWRGYVADLPAWVTVGIAHLMERACRTDVNSFTLSGGTIPPPFKAEDWKRVAADRIAKKKYMPLARLMTTTEASGIPLDERPVVWSMVSFLAQTDPKKFGELYRFLKAKGVQNADWTKIQAEMFRRVYGFTTAEFEAEWTKWVAAKWAR